MPDMDIPSIEMALRNANLQQFSTGVNDVLSASADAQKQQDLVQGKMDETRGIQKITARADGKYTIETTKDHLDYLQQQLSQGMQAHQQLSQIEQVLQGELSRINQQEQNRSPLLGTLATVAANIGMDPRMPPVVRGLSAASAQLNPTPQALTQQKLSILGALEQAGRGRREEERANFEMQYRIQNEQRLQQQGDRRERREGFSSLTSAAGKGELTDPILTAETLKAMDIPENQAKTMAESLVGISNQRRDLEQQKQNAKDKLEQDRVAERERELNQREDFMLKMFDKRQQQSEGKAEAKKAEIPKTLPDKLQKLDAAAKSLDEVEETIKKYGGYMGAVAGRTTAPVAEYFKRDVSDAFTKIKLQVSQAIQATGAGARGFGPMERGFFEKLAESKTKSPEQNLGIVDAWRQYIRQQRSAYLDSYEGLNDPKWKNSFGRDADLIQATDTGAANSKDPLGVR